LDTCEACGRGLQKTNIVKDFAEDLERGICYLPEEWLEKANYTPLSLQGAGLDWKYRILGNVLDELDQASQYVLALPYRAAGYRMASLLCLLPAYQTNLLEARQNEKLFTREHRFKISRQVMARCVMDAQRMLKNNSAILQYGKQIRRDVEELFGSEG